MRATSRDAVNRSGVQAIEFSPEGESSVSIGNGPEEILLGR